MRTIVARKLCTRVFLDDNDDDDDNVAISSSSSGGTSRLVSASPDSFVRYARVRCIRVIGVTRIAFATASLFVLAMCATLDIQSEASVLECNRTQAVENHWYSRNGIKVTKLGEPYIFFCPSSFLRHAGRE